MTETLRAALRRLASASALMLAAGPALADYGLNMTRGVTPFSDQVYGLHMLIFWICVVIGVGVFGAMFASMYLHRRSRGARAAQFQHNTRLEVVWTVVPFLILVAMAVPATRTLIAMEATSGYDMTVKVTGYQWMWGYEYVDEGISFMSALDADSDRVRRLGSGGDPSQVEHYLRNVDNPLVLPVNTKVRFLITAGDVIHSWWVPDLGWKRDAIPGYVNEAWTEIREEGTYRGQCAELCGMDHAFMPVVVEAVSQEQFRRWVARKQSGAEGEPSPAAETQASASADEPAPEAPEAAPESRADAGWTMELAMQRGEQVYARQCVACHQPKGQGMPPAFPSLVDSEIVNGPLQGHVDVVVNGVPGTAMQAFGRLLGAEDLAAVITYSRNAWGLDSGDLVAPDDVERAEGQ